MHFMGPIIFGWCHQIDATMLSSLQFRIVAFNSAGQSAPGEPSGLIQARPRYLAPKILTPLKDINVKAGNNFTIDVEYIGSPDPNVNW